MERSAAAQQLVEKLLPERLDRLRRVTGIPVAMGGTTRRDSNGTRLVLGRLVGTTGRSLNGLVVHTGRGLGGRVMRRLAPFAVDDYVSTSEISHEYVPAVEPERLTSVMAVPVLVCGEVVGVLYGAVRDQRPIGDRALRTAVVVADQLQRDVEARLSDEPAGPEWPDALADLATLIRDTTDPELRARLALIHEQLTGRAERDEEKSVLAPREIDVLRLVDDGSTNLEVAARLGLSEETVKAYLRSAMRRLEVHNRTAAAHRARLMGLL
jgi:DNA-binding CsgD family transcriptional regulator